MIKDMSRLTATLILALIFAAVLAPDAWPEGAAPAPSYTLGADYHTDVRFSMKFKVPKGWIGSPAPAKAKSKNFDLEEEYDEFAFTCEYVNPDNKNTLMISSCFIPKVESFEQVERQMEQILFAPRCVKFEIKNSPKPKGSKKLYKIESDYGPSRISVKLKAGNQVIPPPTVKMYVQVAVILNKRSALALTCFRSERDPVEYDALFEQVLNSFQTLSDSEKSNVKEKYGRKAVLAAGWTVKKTKYYNLHYRSSKEFAETLSKKLETAMDKYIQIFKLPKGSKGLPLMSVKVLDNYEEFIRYSGQSGAAAYFSPFEQELVCYKMNSSEIVLGATGDVVQMAATPEDATFAVIYHEGFHEFLFCYINDELLSRDVPIWINEGMAEYFFPSSYDKTGKFEIGIHTLRLASIQNAISTNTHVPLEKFFLMSKDQYYDQASLCYAQGWAVCYFMLRCSNKKYNGIPKAFIDAIKDTRDPVKAFDQAFAGVDLQKLEAEWKEFVMAIAPPDPGPAKKRKTEFTVTVAVVPDADPKQLETIGKIFTEAAYKVWFATHGQITIPELVISDNTDRGMFEIQRLDDLELVISFDGELIEGSTLEPGEKVLLCAKHATPDIVAKLFMKAFLLMITREKNCQCVLFDADDFSGFCDSKTHKGDGTSCQEKFLKLYPDSNYPNPDFKGKKRDDAAIKKKFTPPTVKTNDT